MGAAIFAIAATVCAVFDWVSVVRERAALERLAKPATMCALVVAVVVLGDQASRWLVVAALVFSLIGDVLLLERFDNFLAGLTAFFVAHLFYVAAFVGVLRRGVDGELLAAGLVVSLVLAATAGTRIVRAAHRSDARLGFAVALYVGALSAMVVAGWATGAAAATVGATVFALSDAVLGWNRFVQTLTHGRLITHVLYHVGQALLSVWAIGL